MSPFHILIMLQIFSLLLRTLCLSIIVRYQVSCQLMILLQHWEKTCKYLCIFHTYKRLVIKSTYKSICRSRSLSWFFSSLDYLTVPQKPLYLSFTYLDNINFCINFLQKWNSWKNKDHSASIARFTQSWKPRKIIPFENSPHSKVILNIVKTKINHAILLAT